MMASLVIQPYNTCNRLMDPPVPDQNVYLAITQIGLVRIKVRLHKTTNKIQSMLLLYNSLV